MPSVSFTCTVGNTNTDLRTGTTINEFFWREGDAPPAGSIITGASLTVSSLKTYSSKGLYLTLGAYGYTSQFS